MEGVSDKERASERRRGEKGGGRTEGDQEGSERGG